MILPIRSARPLNQASGMSLLPLLSLLIALIAPLLQATPVAAMEHSDPPDLQALALNGNDLIGLGFSDYGAKSGYTTSSPDDMGAFLTHWWMDDLNDDGATMRAADARHYYIQILSNEYVDSSTKELLTRSLVVSTILEFDNRTDASQGVDAISTGLTKAGLLSEVDPDSAIDADQVVLLAGTGGTPNPYKAANTFPRTNAILRSGNLVAVVGLFSYDTRDLSRAEFEHLVAIQADRLGAAEGPGLSEHLLRLDVPPAHASFDTYTVLNGVALPKSATKESADGFTARQKSVKDTGLETGMHYEVLTFRKEDGDSGPYAFFTDFLNIYDSPRDARTAFDNVLSSYLDGGFYEFDGPTLGDESAFVFRAANSDGTQPEYAMAFVRVGSTFFILRNSATTATTGESNITLHTSPQGVIILARAQVDCLDDAETCADPLAVPRVLLRDQEHPDATPPAPIDQG